MSSKSHDKFIQEIGAMTVLELADLVKALEEKFGVSAAMPVAAAGVAPAAAGAVEAQEEKTEFKVTLKDAGDKKFDVIKAVRKVTELNLVEAKKAVEEAPTVLAESASKDDAQKIKEALEAAGAKVELS